MALMPTAGRSTQVTYFPLCDGEIGMVCLCKRWGVGPTPPIEVRLIAEFATPDKAEASRDLTEALAELQRCARDLSGSQRAGDWALVCAASEISERAGHLTANSPLFFSPSLPGDPFQTNCPWPDVSRTLVMMDRAGTGMTCVDEAAALLGLSAFDPTLSAERRANAGGVYQVFVAPLTDTDGGFGVYLADGRDPDVSQLVAAFAEPLAAGDMAYRLTDLGQRAAKVAGRDAGDTVVLETARIFAEEAGWLPPDAPLLNQPPPAEPIESPVLPPDVLARIDDLDELLAELACQAEESFLASPSLEVPTSTTEAAPWLGPAF
ncbi:MAG: hypothetical protein ACYDBJ_21620 [Aggregatilineales bacterium]